jgi:hypothetical protein
MSSLFKIRQSGFQVSVVGNNQIAVSPAENLTDNQRDFLRQHKAEIISELQAEQFADNQQSNLKTAHRKLLIDYMAAIGETDQGMVDDFLNQCSQDPEKLRWALSWARSIVKPKHNPEKLVKCCNCSHWRGHHKHQRGSGACAVSVQPLGLCHWFDTPKLCERYQALDSAKN